MKFGQSMSWIYSGICPKPEMLVLNESLPTNSMTLRTCHPGRYKALNLGRIIHNEILFAKSILGFDAGWLECNF